ncbi:asparagine synthetase [glutamine-hydrolyzing] [Tanacetum coccineum]
MVDVGFTNDADDDWNIRVVETEMSQSMNMSSIEGKLVAKFCVTKLKHRGPDWSGLYQHGDNYLAHQRLAIIDPASGDQPLFNEDETIVVTVNGEIYNHEELRKSLTGHTFKTGSDCDVIAHLYEEHGENFVDMLDGMFTDSVLIITLTHLHCCSDAIGITRPLYIALGDVKPVWFNEAIPSTPYDPLVLRRAFEDAVIKRLMTDVPFGVLLSGGLDSSLVASITARHLAGTKAAKEWGAQLHSFCVGLENSAKLTVPGGPSIACSTEKAIEWDASWSKNLDPSGRAALGVHNSAYKESATPIGTANLAPSIIDNMPRTMDISAPGVVIQS